MDTKNTKTTEETKPAVAAIAPQKFEEDEDGMPHALDDKGQRIPDEDIIARGTRPQSFEFRAAGQDHKAFLLMSGVSLETRQAPDVWLRKHLVEQGVTGSEEIESDPDAAQRLEVIEREAMKHPERALLRAQIAVEAIARTSGGRFRISVPQFQDDLSAQKLVADEIFGRRIINEIGAAVADFFTG